MNIWKVIGPGILFAGSAIGVSHLVQSTRAGAQWGLGLVLVLVLANLIKYPAFLFGPLYAAATGHSLLDGYRRQGRWALVLFALMTVGTMFTVEAAVAVVTAGLAKVTFGWEASPQVIAVALVGTCAGILAAGRFRWLDRVIKVTVALLTVTTLFATVLVLPRVEWGSFGWLPRDLDLAGLLFIAAFVGWMPSAIDISVWHSIWSVERRRDTGYAPKRREARIDFDIGYIGTAVMGLCFLVMGAGVFYSSGQTLQPQPAAFAHQVIDLYAETLGAWSRPVIALSAFSVMFSTTLAVVDAFPRVLATLWARFQGAATMASEPRGPYWVSMALVAAGAFWILFFHLTGLASLVDLATTISFLTAPVLAILN
ncbi:MAG: divalent metal cation transporter, partial [Pseudomonadota bacterium]